MTPLWRASATTGLVLSVSLPDLRTLAYVLKPDLPFERSWRQHALRLCFIVCLSPLRNAKPHMSRRAAPVLHRRQTAKLSG